MSKTPGKRAIKNALRGSEKDNAIAEYKSTFETLKSRFDSGGILHIEIVSRRIVDTVEDLSK